MKTRICRHCRRRSVNRPRGLCGGCYYRDGVRDLYPPADERFSSSLPHAAKYRNPNRPASRPTTALPGTPEKVQEMRRRVRYGQAIDPPRGRTP